MMVCPICKTEAQQENQEYCLECAWEFEYFLDELSEEERVKYTERVKIQQALYKNNSTDKPIVSTEVKNPSKINLWFIAISVFIVALIGFYLLFQYSSSTLEISDLKRETKILEHKLSEQVKKNTILNTKADLKKGEKLYARCAGCHGATGELKAFGKSGTIGGKGVDELVEKITKYKNGKLNQYGMGILMKGQVASLSKEDIIDVANYIFILKGSK